MEMDREREKFGKNKTPHTDKLIINYPRLMIKWIGQLIWTAHRWATPITSWRIISAFCV